MFDVWYKEQVEAATVGRDAYVQSLYQIITYLV